MKITVIGPGRWGSFIAWYLNTLNHDVTLYGRESSEKMKEFLESRKSENVVLPKRIKLSTSLESVKDAKVIVISIPSQNLRSLMKELSLMKLREKTIVLCMKGIEAGTGKRLSEVAKEYIGENDIAVWIGPGHIEEFTRGIPNCMVIDSEKDRVSHRLIEAFSGPLIRFYYGCDLLGNEIGAAAKNVIGIAAGMLDGLDLSTLKGALMSRGTHEVSELIKAMGGNPLSAYGLCHLGDYEATVFSKYSHNRMFGEKFVRGEKYEKLAEGYYTAYSIMELCERYRVDMPICGGVYRILYNRADPKEVFAELFTRKLKTEI
ncbi:MAG: NAD(P)H-dependent glycerol-3-phosphate dehydrogenase [Oscillospiraceae bacterium]|nr:NAD(P)H-dependent glycerol-3-phosphate dehydrogenase [Oscillospiraceae bacterium]